MDSGEIYFTDGSLLDVIAAVGLGIAVIVIGRDHFSIPEEDRTHPWIFTIALGLFLLTGAAAIHSYLSPTKILSINAEGLLCRPWTRRVPWTEVTDIEPYYGPRGHGSKMTLWLGEQSREPEGWMLSVKGQAPMGCASGWMTTSSPIDALIREAWLKGRHW